MAQFNLYHVRINEFYKLYEDLIQAIAQSLIDLGHSCRVQQNAFAANAVNVLLGSTIFAARYHNLAAILRGRRYIVYQLEHLDDRSGLLPEWPEYRELLQNAGAIWDYSPASSGYLKNRGFRNVYYLPPAFHRCLESFRPRPDPDIDVLFFGSPHPRRDRIIEALRALGLRVVNLQAVFGEARNRYIARAKIVLNIHAWEGLASLETVRLSLLLANRAFVISEAADHNPYEDGVVYGGYDELVDLCVRHLDQGAAARERIAEKGYLAARKHDQVNLLRASLDAMGKSALDELTAVAGWAIEPADAERREEILAAVPVHARRLLDIGCGDGAIGAGIKRRQACHVTGVDIAAETARQAAALLDLAICGDAFAVLPSLPDRSYDCVLLLDVLDRVTDTAALLRLAAGKLTDDGTLILSLPNIAHWTVVKSLLDGRWDYAAEGILDPARLRFFTLASIRQAVDEVGLQIIDCRAAQLAGSPTPTELLAFAGTAGAASGTEVNLHAYRFVLACRKV